MNRSGMSRLAEKFYKYLLKKTIKNRKIAEAFAIIDNISKFYDPIIEVEIETQPLKINFSHRLPYYYELFPNYDRALSRISKKVKEIDGDLFLIDIGANIGDTVTFLANNVDGNYLCIEGDNEFLQLLFENIKSIKNSNIFVSKTYCADTDNSEKLGVERANGTAKIVADSDSKFFKEEAPLLETLDNIVDMYPGFEKSNVLKIDTDGFELNVLNGAKKLLSKSSPVIYFEFTPEFYINNKQEPMDIIKLLVDNGYETALFYDNFGNPIEIVDLKNFDRILNLISKIDKRTIHYYDILTIPLDKEYKYKILLEKELTYKDEK